VSKNPQVPAKVKAAWQILQDDPAMTLQLAAAAVGLGTRQLRGALAAPHVKKWILEERRLLLETINAGNPEALRRIRDRTENDMAAVNAVKTLEGLKELVDPRVKAGATTHAPGLVVQIVYSDRTEAIGPSPAPPMQIEHDDERDAVEPP
jgi:hypothetical protein